VSLAALCLALTAVAGAQEPTPSAATPSATQPAKPSPADELEPAVDTSATPSSQEAPKPTAAPEPAKPAPAAAPIKSAPARSGRALDRLDLETTEITGNRELPKVLYIVPWKRSDLGDLVGKPVNSLLDEVLEPVDRDVFRRENRYYRALQADSAETPVAAPPK
jgi:hypothetical protein